MAINFPSSPTLNQPYSYGGKTWVWNGSAWDATGTTLSTTAPLTYNSGTQTLALSIGSSLTTSASNLIVDSTVVPYLNAANTFSVGPQTINSGSASNKGIIIKGASSQSANLQEWQNSAGGTLATIDNNGIFNALNAGSGANTYSSIVVGGRWIRNEQRTSLSKFGVSTGEFHMASNPDASAIAITDSQVGVFANTTNLTTFTVKGYASQTANLQEWQDSSGNILAKVNSTGNIYLINPTANNNSNDTPSPAINFQGNIWNSGSGNVNMQGFIKVAAYTGNTNPTTSKLSFGLASDNGSPSEVASFTSGGLFYNIGGLDSAGSSVIFKLRNTTAATSGTPSASPKLELYGKGWNSAQGSTDARGYLQVNINSNNSNPFTTRLGLFSQAGDNTSTVYEVVSVLSTQRVGINSTSPGATLQVNPSLATDTGLIVKGAASQSANLQEWQISNGSVDAAIIPSKGLLLNLGNDLSGSQNLTQISFGYNAPSSPTGYWKHFITTNHNSGSSSGNSISFYTSDGTQAGVYPTNAVLGLSVTNGGIVSPKANINISSASTVGLTVKGAASQTGNLQEWQNSSGTVLVNIDAPNSLGGGVGSYLRFTDAGVGGIKWGANTILGLGEVSLVSAVLYPYASTYKGLVIQGKASQSANLQEWQNSSGTVLAYIDKDGQILTPRLNLPANGLIVEGGTGPYIQMGTSATYLYTRSAANKGLVVQGVASQSANLQEWQNSSGTVLAKVDASGNMTTAGGLFIGDTNLLGYTWAYFSRNGSTGLVTWNQQNYAGASLMILAGNAASQGLIVKGAASQSANIQEWQNSSGTVLVNVTADGVLNAPLVTNAQTASYTLALADAGKMVEMNSASANTLTVPTNATAGYAVGTQINILQVGSGQTTVAGASGVTVNGTPGLKLRAQWSSATLIKRATDTWVLVGDISA